MANYGSPQNNPYPQSEFLDDNTKRPSRVWQQFFINLLNFSKATNNPTGSPTGYMQVTVNGQQKLVPYYDVP